MESTFDIKTEIDEATYGKFVISPLTAGYGNTIGTALKRVLLTSIPGNAISTVRIEGVKHQFSTLKGMKEDVLDLLLNLKKVRIVADDSSETIKLELSTKKEGVVTAGDIKTPSNVRIVNPDLVLANLAKSGSLEIEFEVTRGVGYSSAEERPTSTIGVIPIDAIFSPIIRVNPKIEETRVGRVTNYDKLILEIWTDGTIAPYDALVKAADILISYFRQIVSPTKADVTVTNAAPTDSLGPVGKLSVEEIGLPTRVANALVKSGYETVEKLVDADKNDLIRVRNLGEKSLKVIKAALNEKGVELKDA
jgi:DNA-directed RNA polymerase subunit alpha